MSYYGDLQKTDIVHWLQPLLDAKIYTCRRSDGKFEMCGVTEPTASEWHHIGYSIGAKCPYFHQQLFDIISPRTKIGQFIPRYCQQCWKIVIRPHDLKQLFALESILIQIGWPSKCGIERRSYTPLSKYPYGGYIYNESVEEGLERLDKIREYINGIPELEGVKCYLKRSCTEMELAFPDSTTWEVTAEQNKIEDLLEWLLVYDVSASMTSKHIIDKVHMGWIEWAAQNGDETYLEYTGGKRLYPDCVKYERAEEQQLESKDSAPKE